MPKPQLCPSRNYAQAVRMFSNSLCLQNHFDNSLATESLPALSAPITHLPSSNCINSGPKRSPHVLHLVQLHQFRPEALPSRSPSRATASIPARSAPVAIQASQSIRSRVTPESDLSPPPKFFYDCFTDIGPGICSGSDQNGVNRGLSLFSNKDWPHTTLCE